MEGLTGSQRSHSSPGGPSWFLASGPFSFYEYALIDFSFNQFISGNAHALYVSEESVVWLMTYAGTN